MENLKEEVNKLLKLTGVNNKDELLDKLITIFDRERKKYAFNKSRETLSNVEKYIGNTFSIFELSELVPKDLLIPSELQPGGKNEK